MDQQKGYTQSCGVVDQRAEAVQLFGGEVDVDRSIGALVNATGQQAKPIEGRDWHALHRSA